MKSRKGFTLIELLVIIVIFGILAAVFIPKIAERRHAEKVKADSLAVIDSVVADNTARMEAALEYDQRMANVINKAFLHPVSFIKGNKQEDLICKGYIKFIDMANLVTAPNKSFALAEITLQQAKKIYQDSAIVFAERIGKIIEMPESERKKLEASWAHTCDGMLRPTDLRQLIGAFTLMLRESEAPKPAISPTFRAILLKYYRADLAKLTGNEIEVSSGYEGFYWFSREELQSNKK